MKKLLTKKALYCLIGFAIILTAAIIIVLTLQPKGTIAITKKWKPYTASTEVVPYARHAIEIIDNYLNFKITKEEAKDAFSNIDSRISKLNISYSSKEHNTADIIIDRCITYLYIEADKMTDKDYWLYRDLLAFQIGESTSKNSYSPNQFTNEYHDNTCQTYFKNFISTAYDSTSYVTDSHTSVSADFDYINGMNIMDIYNALECAWLEVPESTNNHSYMITTRYYYYGQEVFSVSAFKSTTETTFMISKPIDFHSISEDEYLSSSAEYFYQFSSLQDIKRELTKMKNAFHS